MRVSGAHVAFVCGGLHVTNILSDLVNFPSIRLLQLPACYVEDQDSWELLAEDGNPVTSAWEKKRRDILLQYFHEYTPHVVVLEMFPFGRRRLHFEVEPLLDACYEKSPRPAIISSCRDVLVTGKTSFHQWSAEMIQTFFDAVLVHGDSTLIPFGATFKAASLIADKLHYSGYVVDSPRLLSQLTEFKSTPALSRMPPPASPAPRSVIISAGGGHSGSPDAMFRAILRLSNSVQLYLTLVFLSARARLPVSCSLRSANWMILVGWVNSEAQFAVWQAELTAFAHEQVQLFEDSVSATQDDILSSASSPCAAVWGTVTVTRARADFLSLVHQADLAISQGGYNTVTEIVAAGWGYKCLVLPVKTYKYYCLHSQRPS